MNWKELDELAAYREQRRRSNRHWKLQALAKFFGAATVTATILVTAVWLVLR